MKITLRGALTVVLLSLGGLWALGSASTSVTLGIPTVSVTPTPVVTPPKLPTVVLDPGHGGNMSGAYYRELAEKDINLAVSLKVQTRLEDLGYVVVMTRTEDVGLGLYERAAMAGEADADLLVSIHSNASEGHPEIDGIMTYHFPEDPEGFLLSTAIHTQVLAETGAGDMGLQAADFVVLREPNMATSLVELGFMSNPGELMRLTDSAYQDQLAKGITDGIHAYMTARGLTP